MLEKKVYQDYLKSSAEKVFGKIADAVKQATAKVKTLIEQPSRQGSESNSLFEGMIFSMPSVKICKDLQCFCLQEFAGNEYIAVLVEVGDKLVPIAKGRWAREPRLLDSDYKLQRVDGKFITEPLPGSVFEIYRTKDKFKDSILAVAKFCEEHNARILVGKPQEVRTSAYNGKSGIDGTETVLIYPMDFIDADGELIELD